MDRDKKEKILDAAAQVFARHGFKKASIDAIARAAKVAKGTVYLACSSKADLFYQAVHRELRQWLGQVAVMVDPRAPADELLEHVARAGVRYLDDHVLVQGLLAGIYEGQFPDWAGRFDELKRLGQANVMEILRMGIKQGRFSPDMAVEETASILQDIHLSSYAMTMQQDLGPQAADRRLDAAMSLVLDGLRVRSRAPSKGR